MFSVLFESCSSVLNFFYASPYLLTLPKDFWSTVALEWLLLQSLFAYAYISFLSFNNYFKQVLALLWILMNLAVYLAFLQLELFACFMFVAEVTIVIFFYSLFLHLRVSTANQNATVNPYTPNILIFMSLVALIPISYGWSWFGETRSVIVFAETYSRTSYMAFSDLSFFATTVLRTNFIIHLLVGLLLLFLTLFLFFITNIYYFLNITSRDAANVSASNLATQRGYYEQTAEEVQKVITNSQK